MKGSCHLPPVLRFWEVIERILAGLQRWIAILRRWISQAVSRVSPEESPMGPPSSGLIVRLPLRKNQESLRRRDRKGTGWAGVSTGLFLEYLYRNLMATPRFGIFVF